MLLKKLLIKIKSKNYKEVNILKLNKLLKLNLLISLLIINSCQNTVENNLNASSKKIDVSNNSNADKTKKLLKVENYETKNNLEELTSGDIIVFYETEKYKNKFIQLRYELKDKKAKLETLSVSENNNVSLIIYPFLDPPNTESFSKNEIEKMKKDIDNKLKEVLSELNSLNSDKQDEKNILEIAKRLSNKEELELYIESIQLIPTKNYISFTSISENEFKLLINEEGMFFLLLDEKNNKKFYVKEGNFIINKKEGIFQKETNYRLQPLITFNDVEQISKIDNFGRIYVKNQINSEYNLSTIFVNKFKELNKLKLSNGIYESTNESGEPEQINLKEISIKEVLKIRK